MSDVNTSRTRLIPGLLVCAGLGLASHAALAAGNGGACAGLPSHAELAAALSGAVTPLDNGGFGNHMWGTIVNRDGVVCAVAFTGNDRGDQWPGSRVISAQKANTGNAFSLNGPYPNVPLGRALSTANLYSLVQSGGSLFGLQESNPVDTGTAYGGNPKHYGQPNDPMVGRRIGGINVFGGGFALYDSGGNIVGGLGVSGDTSCADHNIGWKTRDALGLDNIPGGVSGTGDDNIIYDTTVDPATGHTVSASGFGHPACGFGEEAVAAGLPGTHPIGP